MNLVPLLDFVICLTDASSVLEIQGYESVIIVSAPLTPKVQNSETQLEFIIHKYYLKSNFHSSAYLAYL